MQKDIPFERDRDRPFDFTERNQELVSRTEAYYVPGITFPAKTRKQATKHFDS